MNNTTLHDQLHRFLFDDFDIRGEIVSLHRSYQEATEHQNLPPVVKTLLGEFLAAATLITEVLKFTGTLTLQVRGAGPIPLIMAEANEDKTVRGIVKLSDSHIITPEQTRFRDLIGDGVLSLTLDPVKGKRYQGIVALEGESLADALSNYFAQSEQLPTRLWLSADNAVAAGVLLQALPNQIAEKPANQDAWQTAETLAATLNHKELSELDHSSILVRLFNKFIVRIFPPSTIQFGCRCSRERSANALTSLGRADAEALLAERDLIEMGCEFCGTQYVFSNADLDDIFGDGGNPITH